MTVVWGEFTRHFPIKHGFHFTKAPKNIQQTKLDLETMTTYQLIPLNHIYNTRITELQKLEEEISAVTITLNKQLMAELPFGHCNNPHDEVPIQNVNHKELSGLDSNHNNDNAQE